MNRRFNFISQSCLVAEKFIFFFTTTLKRALAARGYCSPNTFGGE
jgi:hypothetical protein